MVDLASEVFMLSLVAGSKLFIVDLQSSNPVVVLFHLVLQSGHGFSLEAFEFLEQLPLGSEVVFALVLNLFKLIIMLLVFN